MWRFSLVILHRWCHLFICYKDSSWHRKQVAGMTRRAKIALGCACLIFPITQYALKFIDHGILATRPGLTQWLWEKYYREIVAVVSAGSHEEPTCSPRPCRHHWSFLTSLCPSVFFCIWLLAVEWFLIGLWEVTAKDVFLCAPFAREGRGHFLEHE